MTRKAMIYHAVRLAVDHYEGLMDAYTPTYGLRDEWMEKQFREFEKMSKQFKRLLNSLNNRRETLS